MQYVFGFKLILVGTLPKKVSCLSFPAELHFSLKLVASLFLAIMQVKLLFDVCSLS